MAAPVLTPQSEDFPRWYQDVITKAELADNGPVRGTMVIRPTAYAIWERLQSEMDARIKAVGVDNAYFPLFIPESYLRREAEHVEGFSPELAVVTHGGGKELEEPVVVRPTSETIINSYFSKWVQSYRDLPLLINQWANVVRWELRPRLFLRTTEFLWQEGHTCHATEADAHEFALRILNEVYATTVQEVLAIPVLLGRKTERERFAGATYTWAMEAMMGDGKALQMGTSHELGQNFGRAFDTTFQTAEGTTDYVWQTSWGSSTRMLGGLIMTHGDDRGLRLPPSVAPTQCVVIVVRDENGAGDAARALAAELADVRVKLDDRVDVAFGRRSVDHELKGIPVRVEVGPRDLAEGNVTVVRRDTGDKTTVAVVGAAAAVRDALAAVQASLFAAAQQRLAARTVEVSSIDEAIAAAQTGFAVLPGALADDAGEDALNAASVSIRCLQRPDGSVPETKDLLSDLVAVVARAY
ncbi:MAG TPA: proline--tRNA ligase [Acidimicrobiales bacterium]|nr:proline--tRNA ligase [Acidimicrobiales bacterium]